MCANGSRIDVVEIHEYVSAVRRSVNCDIEVTSLANSRTRAALTPLNYEPAYSVGTNAGDILRE